MATTTEIEETLYLGEETRAPGRLRRFWRAHYHRVVGWLAVILFLSAWEWSAASGRANILFTSSPSRVLNAYVRLFTQNNFINDIAVTSQEFALGFGIAIIVAIPLGIAMGWYRVVGAIFDPFVNFLYATPRVALLPLMIIWVGIGINSKILLVFFGAFFAILINTMAGVRNLDESLLRAARSFGAGDFKIFRTIALPGSVPFILTGIRLGLGHALIV